MAFSVRGIRRAKPWNMWNISEWWQLDRTSVHGLNTTIWMHRNLYLAYKLFAVFAIGWTLLRITEALYRYFFWILLLLIEMTGAGKGFTHTQTHPKHVYERGADRDLLAKGSTVSNDSFYCGAHCERLSLSLYNRRLWRRRLVLSKSNKSESWSVKMFICYWVETKRK